jgi:hypothetical protein
MTSQGKRRHETSTNINGSLVHLMHIKEGGKVKMCEKCTCQVTPFNLARCPDRTCPEKIKVRS